MNKLTENDIVELMNLCDLAIAICIITQEDKTQQMYLVELKEKLDNLKVDDEFK